MTGVYSTCRYANAKLVHLAHVVLVAGAVPESISPCSTDCSYVVKFEGPIFQCDNSVKNTTNLVDNIGSPQYYAGGWNTPRKIAGDNINFDTFTMNTTHIYGTIGYPQILQLEERHVLRCETAWATYQVHIAYINGTRSFTYDSVPGGKLVDGFVRGVYPDHWAPQEEHWNTTTIRNLKYLNYYGLLDTIVMALAGSYDQMVFDDNSGTFPYTLSNGTTVEFETAKIDFNYVGVSMSTLQPYITKFKA